ncbi:recombinase family protein [Pararhizobium sp. IMCC21322]|uniref:recombinase family protein n=1 Tax=Pararhizobium sp. IMCC21322 TaxID=3067903 RepID=UPI002741F1D8|nr:recombinase family protein [Pararhizobium sp. IMCC21322]
MKKIAIYARYSSDLQKQTSIEDQIRVCRERAESEGWQVAEVYCDHAISGASLIRPGIQALMKATASGQFSIIVGEALDRFSRDQEDIAHLFKRVEFAGASMFTLSEGEISSIHIGLKGTMNSLFLEDLRHKVRRGLRGRVEKGKSGGGNSYGYDVVKKYDASGEPIRGDRKINTQEKSVILRIFRDYCVGKSPKSIALELNKEGVPSPSGKGWGQSTINGNRRRGTGILNNELYIGRLVWNKVKYIKDPDTGKRVSRLNPESEWIIKELPEHRIVDHDLWDGAKARQKSLDKNKGKLWKNNRPKYLLSQILKCGCCDGGFSMVSATHLGCSTARNKGTCDNRLTMKRETLEQAVIGALQTHLMDEELCKIFCEQYTSHLNALRKEKNGALHQMKKELSKIEREEKKGIQAIFDGFANEALKLHLNELDERKKTILATLDGMQEDKVIFHPSLSGRYHTAIRNLVETLNKPQHRAESAETLRGLLEKIVLKPVSGEARLSVDLHGDLAGILSISTQMDRSSLERQLSWYKPQQQAALVAGVGFEPTTFRL